MHRYRDGAKTLDFGGRTHGIIHIFCVNIRMYINSMALDTVGKCTSVIPFGYVS